MKIDILEAYIWISEVFRVKSGFYRSTGGYRNPPGGIWASVSFCGREERWPGLGRAPLPPLVRIGQGEGGGAPISFLSSTSYPLLLFQQGREGVLLPVEVGLLLARPLLAGRTSPLDPLYTGAGGHLNN